ncbi:MAG: hypothetical protein NPIRA04_22690 [Nitrospirales bacterium]|nr:MAG: hypothetical protein NPIRA04_22690 [Nitrospirales bacterium]
MKTSHTSDISQGRKKLIHGIVLCSLVLFSFPVRAAEQPLPWQCTSYTYTGASQHDCIQSLSDNQETKIDKLERQLKRQEIILHELQEKMSRQTRRHDRYAREYPPSYEFIPPPPVGFGPSPIYGYGPPFGFGFGPLPFVPSIGIIID